MAHPRHRAEGPGRPQRAQPPDLGQRPRLPVPRARQRTPALVSGAAVPPPLQVTTTVESWPIAGEFSIARGTKREANVVVAHVSDGIVSGRGECVPYARYGETVDSVTA